VSDGFYREILHFLAKMSMLFVWEILNMTMFDMADDDFFSARKRYDRNWWILSSFWAGKPSSF